MTATPNGCRWCGIPHRPHDQQWKRPVGWHKWEPPTDAQILARMLARRAQHLAARETARTFRYHARAEWTGMPGNPDDEGDMYCADCRKPCDQLLRIQDRRLRSLYGPFKHPAKQGGWATDPFPF